MSPQSPEEHRVRRRSLLRTAIVVAVLTPVVCLILLVLACRYTNGRLDRIAPGMTHRQARSVLRGYREVKFRLKDAAWAGDAATFVYRYDMAGLPRSFWLSVYVAYDEHGLVVATHDED